MTAISNLVLQAFRLRSVASGVAMFIGLLSAFGADDSTLTQVGDKCPVTSVRTLDGREVRMEGQVVLLNFFATWCGPCMTEMPHLQKEVWERFEKQGLTLIAVGREHSEAEVKAFKEKKGFTFSFAADPKRDVFGKFAKQSIPRCVLVGKDGRIKYQSIGFEKEEFEKLVAAVKKELETSKAPAAR